MTGHPEISIIVPVYNVMTYLPVCLDSIIGQDFTDWEAIVVDDGSTDGSGEICDRYAKIDSRIRVFHQRNAGVSVARNEALKMARGRFIGFVDSDDWIAPTFYSTLYRLITENDADISQVGFFREYPKRSVPIYDRPHLMVIGHERGIREIFEDRIIHSYTWSKLFRREMIDPEFPAGVFYEDFSVLIQWFGNADKIVLSSEPLYHYRMRHGSTVHEKDAFIEYCFFMAVKARVEFMRTKGIEGYNDEVFRRKLLDAAVGSAKKVARYAPDKKERRKYIDLISREIRGLMPVGDIFGKRKKALRVWKLAWHPRWFEFTVRFSYAFEVLRRIRHHEIYR